MPASLLKVTSDSIVLPLWIIFNLSLQSGIISDIWKHNDTSVVPVFKKESPGDPCNYRPISLTCIVCKLMEAGIKRCISCLSQGAREHKIINASQHGFMAKNSTTKHLFKCNLDRNTAIRSRHGVDIVYSDFAKAFDWVVHITLVAKLRCYSVCGMILRLIESRLCNRY